MCWTHTQGTGGARIDVVVDDDGNLADAINAAESLGRVRVREVHNRCVTYIATVALLTSV